MKKGFKILMMLALLEPSFVMAKAVDLVGDELADKKAEARAHSKFDDFEELTRFDSFQENMQHASKDANTKIVDWSEGKRIDLDLRANTKTIIVLPKGDIVHDIYLPGRVTVRADKIAGDKILLSSIGKNVDGNMFVTGRSGLIYPFRIMMHEVKTKVFTDYVVYIKTKTPIKLKSSDLDAINKRKRMQEVSESLRIQAEQKDFLRKRGVSNVKNGKYTIKANKYAHDIVPSAVWDDNVWTYFDMAHVGEYPLLYKLVNDVDMIVNYEITSNGLWKAKEKSDAWLLRAGEKKVEIEARKGNGKK